MSDRFFVESVSERRSSRIFLLARPHSLLQPLVTGECGLQMSACACALIVVALASLTASLICNAPLPVARSAPLSFSRSTSQPAAAASQPVEPVPAVLHCSRHHASSRCQRSSAGEDVRHADHRAAAVPHHDEQMVGRMQRDQTTARRLSARGRQSNTRAHARPRQRRRVTTTTGSSG